MFSVWLKAIPVHPMWARHLKGWIPVAYVEMLEATRIWV